MVKEKFRFYFLWLSLVCIGVFILQNLPGIPGFTEMFVLNSGKALGGEFWRFVSSMFLHSGITHLIYNLFALLFFGGLLEKLIGSKRFLVLFFISGIGANLVSVWFYPSSLGASGAIYGILGALAVLKPMVMVWAFGLILPMFLAAILWIIGGVIGIFVPSNTGHIAHLSGIGVGIILGLILLVRKGKKKLSKKENKVVIPDYYMAGWEKRYMK